jgi:hypothetical protein
MAEKAPYPYTRGILWHQTPALPIPEHCTSVDAGPLQLVIEYRDLVSDHENRPDPAVYDDLGACLHVFGSDDGAEHLRFDAFDKEPHYHYLNGAKSYNLVCRIDEIAEGDPVAWTMNVFRNRLPEMLSFAGAEQLAEETRARLPEVMRAVDEVGSLLDQAREKSRERRAASVSAGG